MDADIGTDSIRQDLPLDERENQIESKAEKIGRIIGALLVVPAMILALGILVGILVAAVFVIRDAAIADAPAPSNPSFIDQIIASKAVLVSLRLALITACGYLVLSLSMLAIRRQWISKIGWVEIGNRQVAANDELVFEHERLYSAMRELADENEELKAQLRQADTIISAFLGEDDDLDEEAAFS